MAYWRRYIQAIIEAEQAMMEREATAIEKVASRITESLREGGVLHLFGTGHSHLPLEEAFHRSGGLAPINPLLDPSLMFHEGLEKGSALERWEGYATNYVVPKYDLRPGEVMIIFSTSGRNPAPIEVALAASEKRLYTVGVTSRRITAAYPSRHSSGKHLDEVVDMVLDLDVPPGDNVITIEEMPEVGTTGGASTILAMLLINAILCQVVENFVRAGEAPPLLLCPNAGNAEDIVKANRATLQHYRSRLPHL
jgi:uncharacterized phosphosugar-binding protein